MSVEPERIARLQETLESDRSSVEAIWSDVARYVVPELDRFFGGHQVRQRNRPEQVLDTMPSVALDRCAAILTALATPHEQEYHTLRVSDEKLNGKVRVQRYLHEVNALVRRARYGGKANFRRPSSIAYRSITAFGPGAIFLADGGQEGPKYAAVQINNLYLATDPFGVINRAHRRLMWTAEDILRNFPHERVPEKIHKEAARNSQERHEIIHAIWPNDDMKSGRIDKEGMPWLSFYVLREGRAMLEEGGYQTWPLAVFRYQVYEPDPYGWSPAMKALGDIKMLQAYAKTHIRQAHMALDPVLLTRADSIPQVNWRPGGMIHGGLDYAGNPIVRPAMEGANFAPAIELTDRIRQTINDHFLVNMIQFLVDSPQMTATEVLQNAREQGILFAPTANLLYGDEALMGMVERELDILSRNGDLPEPPPELVEAQQDGISVDVEFDSPMTRNMSADNAVGIARTYEFAANAAQYDPSIMYGLDHDEALRHMAKYQGAPPTIIRPRDEAQALRDKEMARQEAAQAAQALPQVAGAVKDLSEAGANAQQG